MKCNLSITIVTLWMKHKAHTKMSASVDWVIFPRTTAQRACARDETSRPFPLSFPQQLLWRWFRREPLEGNNSQVGWRVNDEWRWQPGTNHSTVTIYQSIRPKHTQPRIIWALWQIFDLIWELFCNFCCQYISFITVLEKQYPPEFPSMLGTC